MRYPLLTILIFINDRFSLQSIRKGFSNIVVEGSEKRLFVTCNDLLVLDEELIEFNHLTLYWDGFLCYSYGIVSVKVLMCLFLQS